MATSAPEFTYLEWVKITYNKEESVLPTRMYAVKVN